ncbi:hypothetical protein [Cohnella sp.]|uniref:hypothetical protein n=1 Tax=Cohnella sp. TaxID=1883426 RepID=UPI00356AA2DF
MPKVKPALCVLFLLLTCVFFAAIPASAATVELSAPIRGAFDKTVASADSKTATKLNSLYKELGTLLEQDRNTEAKIKALHYRNEEALIALRKQIRVIDADKLGKLEAQVKQTKDRYKPLFALYTSVNKQITIAKSLKNKTLNSLLRAQADGIKLSVQFARQDIKNKENNFKAAKGAAALKIKAARDTLATIDPLKVQIKAQRSAASLPRKSLSPVWTNFKYAIKKSDARSTLDSLAMLVILTRQIMNQQLKIEALEIKISGIITRTKAQIV